ncbi:hypothetical protein ABZ508_02645 [Streptomyces lavendulocolor]|uniref:Secreted protein n=1 Tax=Streptomyces lavendulocolor TaxID=67316 RepID=A0ABV2VYA1_9ACTN
MRTRTTLAAVGLLLALTACSSGQDAPPPTTTPSSAPPSLSADDIAQQCADALYQRVQATQGEVPSEPRPPECAPLSDAEYLDAYMASLEVANDASLDERQDEREDAEQQDQ